MSIKPILQQVSANNPKKLCNLKLKNPNVGNIALKTEKYKNKNYMFITQITNENDERLGFEIFDLRDNQPQEMFGYTIEVARPYRGKNLAELLRLSSIIEMLENGINALKIYSKNTAILFHSKYGFEPAIKQFDQRNLALQEMANCNLNGFKDIKEKAEKILEEVTKTPIQYGEFHRQKCKETNKLFQEFIKKLKMTNNEQNINFSAGCNMQLDRETILNNAKYYNELFKKHSIDYKITT